MMRVTHQEAPCLQLPLSPVFLMLQSFPVVAVTREPSVPIPVVTAAECAMGLSAAHSPTIPHPPLPDTGPQLQPFVDDAEDFTFTAAQWALFLQSFFGLLERTKVTSGEAGEPGAAPLAALLVLSQVGVRLRAPMCC
jgi:hypothetical protein